MAEVPVIRDGVGIRFFEEDGITRADKPREGPETCLQGGEGVDGSGEFEEAESIAQVGEVNTAFFEGVFCGVFGGFEQCDGGCEGGAVVGGVCGGCEQGECLVEVVVGAGFDVLGAGGGVVVEVEG
nr:hypothetical protein [Brevibacterium sp. 91QC2O2]